MGVKIELFAISRTYCQNSNAEELNICEVWLEDDMLFSDIVRLSSKASLLLAITDVWLEFLFHREDVAKKKKNNRTTEATVVDPIIQNDRWTKSAYICVQLPS